MRKTRGGYLRAWHRLGSGFQTLSGSKCQCWSSTPPGWKPYPWQWHIPNTFRPKKDVSPGNILRQRSVVFLTSAVPYWQTLGSLNRTLLHTFRDKHLTSLLPLPKTGLFVALFPYFGFKGVKSKLILTVRIILFLLRQIPSKLNELDR